MDREKEAWEDLRRSQLGTGAKWVLLVTFLGTVFAVLATDLFNPYGLRDAWNVFAERSRPLMDEKSLLDQGLAWNRENLRDIEAFEDQLAEESVLRRSVPYYQWFFVSLLKTSGTGRVLIGQDRDWYFLKDALETTLGWTEPARLRAADGAVRRLAGILRARGISLIVAPVPGKADVLPARFSRRFQSNEFLPVEETKRSIFENWNALPGVTVIPVGEVLTHLREDGGLPYLERDSHWSPEGMEAVTRKIAETVQESSAKLLPETAQAWISGEGDLVGMMQLPQPILPEQRVTVKKAAPRTRATDTDPLGLRVFYMGDSFSAIYSDPDLGWGAGAGVQDWLPALLGTPVDFRLNYGDPVSIPARQLERVLEAPERSHQPTVVIWQFAERFLNTEHWNELFRGIR